MVEMIEHQCSCAKIFVKSFKTTDPIFLVQNEISSQVKNPHLQMTETQHCLYKDAFGTSNVRCEIISCNKSVTLMPLFCRSMSDV